MKEKVSIIKDSYKNYRFKNDRYKVSADYAEYNKIATCFFKKLFENLVTTGKEYELPSKLGIFVLEQYDTEKYRNKLERKNKPFWNRDINSEKRYFEIYGIKKEIPYDSSETDGRMWTFSWIKSKNGTFRNKQLYSFSLVRSNVRSTSNKNYSEKSNRLTVHDFYKEKGYKIYRNLIRIDYSINKENNENK